MSHNETILRLNSIQINILKTIGILIISREKEINISKKTIINAHTIAKRTGHDLKTCKKYLKQLKEIC